MPGYALLMLSISAYDDESNYALDRAAEQV